MSTHSERGLARRAARSEGFDTIGSSGHEGSATLGFPTRTDDPVFRRCRSGGIAERIFMVPYEHCDSGPGKTRLTGASSYMPPGTAAGPFRPSDESVCEAASALCATDRPDTRPDG